MLCLSHIINLFYFSLNVKGRINMKNIKRISAALLAICISVTISGCDKDSDSSYNEEISVPTADQIEAIPDDAEKTLDWCSYYDLNPSSNSEEKYTNVALFEDKGGKINYINCGGAAKKYDKLSELILANTPPDLFAFEQKMTFPAGVIKERFQSIDSVVDFDSPLWSDVKNTAEQFSINGKHYVAPIAFGTLSTLTYDLDVIQNEGLEDPYEIYKEGNWDWDAFYDIMKQYVSNAKNDEVRYGINGWYHSFIFQSTGQTIITKDPETGKYTNNIKNANLERAGEFLSKLTKEGLDEASWFGDAAAAFRCNVLFYAMGPWASTGTHTPQEGTRWGVVPIPRDPNTDIQYTTLDINAYMWVKGSTKNEAVKCWYECSKLASTADEYKKISKEKFFVDNPNWTEEAYQVTYEDVISDDFVKVIDPGYGISTLLSDDDAATNVTKEAIIPYLYSSVRKFDDSGTQITWTQVREKYTATIDSELKEFNEDLENFIENDK